MGDRDRIRLLKFGNREKIKKRKQTDRMSNEKVSIAVNKNKTLLNTIMREEWKWMGHVMKGKGILMTVLEVTVNSGKK